MINNNVPVCPKLILLLVLVNSVYVLGVFKQNMWPITNCYYSHNHYVLLWCFSKLLLWVLGLKNNLCIYMQSGFFPKHFKSVVFVICWVLGLTKWGCLSNHSIERVWSTLFAVYIFQIRRSYLWCLIKIIMCTSVEGNNGSGKLGMENANESIIETEIENGVMMSTNWLYM